MPEALKQIPLVVWLVCACLLLVLGRYLALTVQRRRSTAGSGAALDALARVAAALREYAAAHAGALPAKIERVAPRDADGFIYRPVTHEGFDERLIVLYDRLPQHAVLEFPALRPGRAVYLLGGKVVVVSEEQFEKLLAADEALRRRCGLDPLVKTGGGQATPNE